MYELLMHDVKTFTYQYALCDRFPLIGVIHSIPHPLGYTSLGLLNLPL